MLLTIKYVSNIGRKPTSCNAAFRSSASDDSQVDAVLLGQVLGGGAGKNLVAWWRLLPHTCHWGIINL